MFISSRGAQMHLEPLVNKVHWMGADILKIASHEELDSIRVKQVSISFLAAKVAWLSYMKLIVTLSLSFDLDKIIK